MQVKPWMTSMTPRAVAIVGGFGGIVRPPSWRSRLLGWARKLWTMCLSVVGR